MAATVTVHIKMVAESSLKVHFFISLKILSYTQHSQSWAGHFCEHVVYVEQWKYWMWVTPRLKNGFSWYPTEKAIFWLCCDGA